ncbi:dihydropyrimidinase [Azospirillum sp. SYSU D00513]|uniref:dihydropyrimidinase n=1 Tax=Azospirillum sp. SYSU D00513 TaxID=2812561 RepID=UPI001A96D3B3|nr:dihydropyrimidinase [Azospirillum sp. SYSU D00513]
MADFDRVIRNGTVVTAADVSRCDIGIRDGRIVALAERIVSDAPSIDAAGRLVMPGGIDSHVHIAQDGDDGTVMADDFLSGTTSAACGGNTTVIPFALQAKGRSLRAAVQDYHAKADGRCLVDYAFHLIVSDPTEGVLGQELPALVKDGYTSFKVFMTYDGLKLNDRELLEVFDVARRERALVMVHAENYDAIRFLTDRLERAGRTEPYYHTASRPVPVEREATHRAISFAEMIDVPIMIVHVSSADAIEQIRWAQGRGLKVFAETCPQYLTLTAEDLKALNMEGEKYVCSPPPRDKASQEACWTGLGNGLFSVFSSDHCPFRYDSPAGKKKHGERTAFRWVPNGIPGVETRLPILFSEGVGKGRLSLQQFVALTSTNHAQMYGLAPRKGSIAVGADADIAIWDPERRVTITQDLLHHGADYTPYEGMEVTGWPETVLVRGETVVEAGRVVGRPGHGRFLKRDLSPFAAPRGIRPTEYEA